MKLKSKILAAAAPLALACAVVALPSPAHADGTPECNSIDDIDGPDDDPTTTDDNIYGSTECGVNSSVVGNRSTATGHGSRIFGDNGTATGQFSTIVGDNSTATGQFSFVYGNNSTATGRRSFAVGGDNSAFGAEASAGGYITYDEDNNIILVSPFENDRNTAIGRLAQAGATAAGQNDATALGYDAQANVLNGLALGANSRATAANAVALGQGSVADRANSVSVGIAGGERQITHVAAGTQATDAVNKAQLDVVEAKADAAQVTATSALAAAGAAQGSATAAQATANAAVANAATAQTTANTARTEAAAAQATANTGLARNAALGQATAAALGGGSAYNATTGAISAPSYAIGGTSYNNVGAAFAAVDTRIDALAVSSGRGFERANGGIAAAMAMGGTMIVPDSTVSMSFNLATYRGEQGFSGAVAVRAAPRVYISGGFAGSTVKGSTGGRVGVAFGF